MIRLRAEGRKKVDERKGFTYIERCAIKSKSNGRCAHCGKVLLDFTIDHVIPIEKGGTNDIGNLVALCKGCNTYKNNYVIHPLDFYKYLLYPYVEELVYNQNRYYDQVQWLTNTNFLPEDRKEIRTSMILPNIQLHRRRDVCSVPCTYWLSKAVYADLDSIYDFVVRYCKKYLGDRNESDWIKRLLTVYFDSGCLYHIRNRANEVVGLIPIRISRLPVRFEGYEEQDILVFDINNFLVSRSDFQGVSLMLRSFGYVLEQLSRLHIGGYGLVVFLISYARTNRVSAYVGDYLTNCYGVCSFTTVCEGEEEDLFDYSVCACAENIDDGTREKLPVMFPEIISAKHVIDYARDLEERLVRTQSSGSECNYYNYSRYRTSTDAWAVSDRDLEACSGERSSDGVELYRTDFSFESHGGVVFGKGRGGADRGREFSTSRTRLKDLV